MAKVDDPHLKKHKEEIIQFIPQRQNVHPSGVNDVTQEELKTVQKTQQKFSQVVQTSNDVLARI